MSSTRRLPIALATMVALLGLTVWAYRAKRAHDELPSSEANVKLPTVKAEEVVELEIRRPNEPVIKLVRSPATATGASVTPAGKEPAKGDWKMTEPVQADTDESAIKTALDALAELKVRSVAATKKENHAKLEVDEAHAVRVIAKHKDAVAIDMLVGASRSGGTMVRLQGKDQVLAVQGALKWTFNKPPRDWRNRVIVDISSDQITSLTVTKPTESFAFVKEGDAWKLGPKQKKIENFDPGKVSSLVSTLSDIRASDFAPPDTHAEGAGLGSAHATVIRMGLRGDKDTTGSTNTAKEIVLKLGAARGDEGHYLMREGSPVVFLISKYLADLLTVDASKLQKSKEAEAKSADAPAPTGMPAMPPGMMPTMQQGM
jgi:hypothetical protein